MLKRNGKKILQMNLWDSKLLFPLHKTLRVHPASFNSWVAAKYRLSLSLSIFSRAFDMPFLPKLSLILWPKASWIFIVWLGQYPFATSRLLLHLPRRPIRMSQHFSVHHQATWPVFFGIFFKAFLLQKNLFVELASSPVCLLQHPHSGLQNKFGC